MCDENLWTIISEKLREQGIDAGQFCCQGSSPGKVKVVCVAPNLAESMKEVGDTPRDQVIMTRIDGVTAEQLDAWIAAGAAKSRSEAAALFIREGLKVRADELSALQDALQEVHNARARLQEKARSVFGKQE